MKSGYFIKLDRSITQHWLWNDRRAKPFSYGQAWIDLILMANIKDKKGIFRGEIYTYKRGNVYTSKAILQERWGWGVKRLNSFLSLLENDEMAHTEAHTDGTIITIVNYDNFNTTEHTKAHTKEQAEEHRGNIPRNEGGATTKEYIENEENYREYISPTPERLIIPPTVDMVREYCLNRMNGIDAEEFVDFYTSKGWMVGKNKMKDWQSAIRTWEKSKRNKSTVTNWDTI